MLLFYLFTVFTAIQTGFTLWMVWTAGPSRTGKPEYPACLPPVSVLICARNEAANLEQFLPAVLSQDYPDYEVVVVNDASEDATATVLGHLARQYPVLRIVTIAPDAARFLPGKKLALHYGLSAARHDRLLLTDADCRPASANWIRYMTAALDAGKEIVAGYGAYSKGKGMLNRFIRWETLHTFIQYSAYAHSGLPYMATGRNLACTRKVLQHAMQSPVWASMPSGDDDLLIRLSANKNNMTIVAEPDAFTYSPAKTKWSEWLSQKQRHVSTGKLYKRPQQFLLAFYGSTHALMWLSFGLLQCTGYGHLAWLLMLLRCLMAWGFWWGMAISLREKGLCLILPLCDFGWACYNFALSPYIFFKTKRRWK